MRLLLRNPKTGLWARCRRTGCIQYCRTFEAESNHFHSCDKTCNWVTFPYRCRVVNCRSDGFNRVEEEEAHFLSDHADIVKVIRDFHIAMGTGSLPFGSEGAAAAAAVETDGDDTVDAVDALPCHHDTCDAVFATADEWMEHCTAVHGGV